ncbi:hypothetical protein [Streptomyces halstedii]|uniref:hypothetical protein n=1 Tax=Streptomyces halstedii TaxID=1944 RepID=UPI00381C36CC
MIAVVFLLPPFLLVSVVLLGRYEDRILTTADEPHPADRRHLRLVSPEQGEEPARHAEADGPPTVRRSPHRHAA